MAYDFKAALQLQAEIEQTLPEFAKSVRSSADVVLMHQDAFAADLQPEELLLLGKAIKYAGMLGKDVQIHGRHRETV